MKFYNFLTRKKEIFEPSASWRKKEVGLYTCGPTVYNYAHIGNLRTYIFEDVLRRTLEYAGYKVKHVMNITDVDDKIIKSAAAKNKPIEGFVKPYEKAFFEDLQKLNIEPAWKYPKATGHISEMLKLIKKLLEKKLAYKTDDGIFFDISKFSAPGGSASGGKKYGRLSQLKKREIKIGARVAADEYEKGSAEDFVLWKAAKPGEPSWQAPFGAGRPGWHIECSAMSMKYLGATFDIHAGGVDLLFPHHENEIAQSEAATGKKFVKYFMEGEHLLVDGAKMSKSLGNIYTLSEIEEKASPLALRYLVLGAHYRSKLNFTWESLGAAEKALERLRQFVLSLRDGKKPIFVRASEPPERGLSAKKLASSRSDFQKAIFNDLDTPKALAVIWKLIHEYNKSAGWRTKKFNPKEVLSVLYEFDKVLGLGLKDIKPEKGPPAEALKLVKNREDARKAKNFTLADEIRRKINDLGWQVNDSPSGSQVFHL